MVARSAVAPKAPTARWSRSPRRWKTNSAVGSPGSQNGFEMASLTACLGTTRRSGSAIRIDWTTPTGGGRRSLQAAAPLTPDAPVGRFRVNYASVSVQAAARWCGACGALGAIRGQDVGVRPGAPGPALSQRQRRLLWTKPLPNSACPRVCVFDLAVQAALDISPWRESDRPMANDYQDVIGEPRGAGRDRA